MAWPGAITVLVALLIVVLAVRFDHAAEVMLLWPLGLFGIAALGFALWRSRQWLLLVCLPVFVAPLGFAISFGMAVANCGHNCP